MSVGEWWSGPCDREPAPHRARRSLCLREVAFVSSFAGQKLLCYRSASGMHGEQSPNEAVLTRRL